MAGSKGQWSSGEVWRLAARQHGVLARWQLLEIGLTPREIEYRVARRRLHPVRRGAYAVGRPQLTRDGEWMAALLTCGPHAWLSHGSAGALWAIGVERTGVIEISFEGARRSRRPGIVVHRRTGLGPSELMVVRGIPVTSPVRTIVDLASRLSPTAIEAAISEADRRDLCDPEALRSALDAMRGQPGVAAVRSVLDRRTFRLTDSELERLFLPIAREAGLSPPLTGRRVSGFKVDFYWPDLGLVVETDGLRYHRTASQQGRDRVRDQAHAAAGLIALRFTHAQVRFEPGHVRATLVSVAGRLASRITS